MKKRILVAVMSALLAASPLLPSLTPSAIAESSFAYTVQPGDTLSKIAGKFHVGSREIANANKLSNPNVLRVGQRLIIPQIDSKVVTFQNRVVALTNQQRAKFGLAPLKMNMELQRMARVKSEDMRNRNYFDHNSPTYGSPFNMMKTFGISYSYAGENIAAGQQTPESVVDAWMKSPGHRANILKKEYTEIGCGAALGGNYGCYWTQEFIRR